MWYLKLNNNNMAYRLARQSFSNDVGIVYFTNNSEHEFYYLTSQHFGDLPEEDYEKAYYKAVSFLRLINGCLLLNGDLLLYSDKYIVDLDERGIGRNRQDVVGRNILEYTQLVNPFENIETEDIKSQSYLANCFTMVKLDEKVRRVIGLLYLYYRDNLYLLVNAYKIYEIILEDLKVPKNGQPYKKMRENLPENLLPYLDYFILGDFSQYANTLINSEGTEVTGIFARHGASKSTYDKKPIDHKELDIKLRDLINAWLSIKIKDRLGVSHDEKYQNSIFINRLTDEDFILPNLDNKYDGS